MTSVDSIHAPRGVTETDRKDRRPHDEHNRIAMIVRRCKVTGCKVVLAVNALGLFLVIVVNSRSGWLSSAVDSYYSRNHVFRDVNSPTQDDPLRWEPAKYSAFEDMESAKKSVVKSLLRDDSQVMVPSGGIDMSVYKYSDTLNFVPPVPHVSSSDNVFKLDSTIMDKFLVLKPREYTETVVILTPIHDSEKSLMNFVREINSLNYPRHLISVVFGEDGSHDETLNVAHELAKDLKDFGFARTEVLHFNISGQVAGHWHEIHHITVQYARRKHLAQARNLLLKGGLKNEKYVLWIDSDIGSLPPDLIQQLMYADKDVVTPICLFTSGGRDRVYDKNTWRETKQSLKDQKRLGPYDLVVEGYGETSRIFLPDLRGEGRVVPIDGVGGCSLMIKSYCHKKGLIFPEEIYDHHIETEGLAKMAKKMNFGVFGLPFVTVYHS